MIRIPQVRVVDEEGAQLGVMPTPQALAMAQERGLDLVEVAPMAAPPVVKFLDFGQYKYELTKREKENKRRQRSVTFKEVRLSPKIGSGDFETKVHRAVEFLEDGDRIKVTVRFRGRELTHPELGRNMLQRFTERIKDHGVAERAPLLEGKSMHLTVASLHKPKEHEAGKPVKARTDQEGAEGAPEAADAADQPATTATPAPAQAPATAATATTTPAPAATTTTTPAPAAVAAPAATTAATDTPAPSAPTAAPAARSAPSASTASGSAAPATERSRPAPVAAAPAAAARTTEPSAPRAPAPTGE
jgi:translation initiation factor IF-3